MFLESRIMIYIHNTPKLIIFFSSCYLSVWKCISIVARNSSSVTPRIARLSGYEKGTWPIWCEKQSEAKQPLYKMKIYIAVSIILMLTCILLKGFCLISQIWSQAPIPYNKNNHTQLKQIFVFTRNLIMHEFKILVGRPWYWDFKLISCLVY